MRKTSKRGGKEININRNGSSISIDKILSNGELGTRWYSEKEILEMSKLQELIKERLRKLNAYKFDKVDDDLFELSMRDSIETDIHTLQSLVEESEK